MEKQTQNGELSPEWDVIVIGAGPAGASAALKIASSGGKVLLISKDRSPGENKACAGGLPLVLARRLKLPERIIEKYIDGFSIVPSNYKASHFYLYPKCVTVYRRNFDPYLTRMATDAGAFLLNETSVHAVERIDQGLLIKTISTETKNTEYTSRLVIFADGVNSLAFSNLAIGFQRRDNNVMSTYLFEIEAPGNKINYFEVFYDPVNLPWGYFWIAPKRDRLNIGIASALKAHDQPLRPLLENYCDKSPSLRGLPKAITRELASLVPLLCPPIKLSTDNAIVCGDAAGLTHPMTFSGIPYAIKSGELAGQTACAALRHHDFSASFLSRFSRQLYFTPLYQWMNIFQRRYQGYFSQWKETDHSEYEKMQAPYFLILSIIGRYVRSI